MSIRNYVPDELQGLNPGPPILDENIGGFSIATRKDSFRFITPIIAFLFAFNYGGDVYWPPWSALMMLSLTFIAFMVWRKESFHKFMGQPAIPISAILLFWYASLNGILFSSWRPLTYGLDLAEVVTRRGVASHTLYEGLILSILFYCCWSKIRRPVAHGLFLGGAIHAFFLIFDQTLPHVISIPKDFEWAFNAKGLLGNRSIGASFTAVWVFFTFYIAGAPGFFHGERSKRIARLLGAGLGVPAILVSVSSISFGALIVGFMAFFILWAWEQDRGAIPFIIGGSLALAVAGWEIGPLIDADWGKHITRLEAWPMFYEGFGAPTLIGAGLGSFKVLGPTIQQINNWNIGIGEWWLWAHCDWLQILLELGIVGAILSACVYISLLLRSLKRPLLFSSVIAYGVILAGNYPQHVAIFALFAWWLAFETWKEA